MGTEISGYILNRGSGMMQSTTFTGAETSGYILDQSSGMMQSDHIHEGCDLWIHFEPKFRDDAIPPHSRRPKSPDLFWTDVPGWYNPSSFSRTEVTGSLLDRCPEMIQSLFILEDRGHCITFGWMSQHDTIPLHSRGPRSPDHFRESSQGWYNPTTTPSLSRKCSNFTRDRGFVSTSATCSSVLTYWSFMAPFCIISWM